MSFAPLFLRVASDMVLGRVRFFFDAFDVDAFLVVGAVFLVFVMCFRVVVRLVVAIVHSLAR